MMLPPEVQQLSMLLIQQSEQGRWIDQARAGLLEHYLNYTPTALNLQDHARAMITEALIKGMGTLWTEVYMPRGSSRKMVGSFFDTVDNLVIDPDAESLQDAQWVARRCVHPVWEVEREYGLRPGSIRGSVESIGRAAEVDSHGDGDYHRKRGMTNDLLVYWKIYSKMGIGGRMSGLKLDETTKAMMELFGDYCYLVICEEQPYPLNLPPEFLEAATSDQEVMARANWPSPHWAEGGWPFCELRFHSKPRQVWPISHIKPGMGELMFINWVFSFLTSKIRVSSRDFIAVAKSAGEEIKNAITHGQDYTLIEIERSHGTVSEVVQFLQHPAFNGEIYNVLEAVMELFDKRVGLSELVYGMSSRQMRSASEAQLKSDQIQIRPDDMAQKTEVSMTQAARNEALAARWHLKAYDVEDVLGPEGSFWWSHLVESAEPEKIIHQLEYRIEAGSARKPNRAKESEDANNAMQMLFQPLFQYSMSSGNVSPVNALIRKWAKAMDMDADPLLISPPLPPPPVAPEGATIPMNQGAPPQAM
jgi:hypothetical protein